MIQHKRMTALLIILVSLAGCAAPTNEKIRLPGELPGWKLGLKVQDRLTSSVRWEHIPVDEYISKWSRRYTVQFYDTRQTDLQTFMNGLRAKLTQRCKSIQWQVLDKQANALLYEWRSMGCKRYQQHHELAILVRGKHGLHRAAYSEKKPQISTETYQLWKKKLLGAWVELGSP